MNTGVDEGSWMNCFGRGIVDRHGCVLQTTTCRENVLVSAIEHKPSKAKLLRT